MAKKSCCLEIEKTKPRMSERMLQKNTFKLETEKERSFFLPFILAQNNPFESKSKWSELHTDVDSDLSFLRGVYCTYKQHTHRVHTHTHSCFPPQGMDGGRICGMREMAFFLLVPGTQTHSYTNIDLQWMQYASSYQISIMQLLPTDIVGKLFTKHS